MSIDLKELKVQSTDNNLNPFKVKVFVRGVQLKTSNILNLVIKESIFSILPKIELTWNDYGLFSDVFPLGDADEITVEISTHKELTGINATFTIVDYNLVPVSLATHSNYYIYASGILKNKSMLNLQKKAFRKMLSTDALNDIFEEQGFNVIKMSNSKDTMTWICNDTAIDAVQRILDYSYINDKNILFAYVDKNKNAYINDLTTIVNKPKSFDAMVSIDPMKMYYSQIEPKVGVRGELKILGYNFFRMGFHPGFNNKSGGYGIRGSFYNFDKPTQKSIDIADTFKPLTEYSLKHRDVKEFTDFPILPMKYKNSNVHENYHKAYLQNKYIKKSLFSDVLIMNTYFNDEVKLMDKVNIKINALAHSGADTPEMNKIYSGNYIIVGITNQFGDDGTYKSQLYLSRGGINKSAFTEETEMKLK